MAVDIRSQNLKKILAALWTSGIYESVSLPAVVVCGDQSCGKSSVLEALTGIPFPIEDGFCTKFVTIVKMTQGNILSIRGTIIPSDLNTPHARSVLEDWNVVVDSIAQLHTLITAAEDLMQCGKGKGFLRDTLVIEISSPDLPIFTFIDVPGLIQITKDGQPDSDIAYLEELVKNYMRDPTKIILTVVAANTDIELQRVLRYAHEIDPKGERTIGVITKPDACEDRPIIRQTALRLLNKEGYSKYQWRLGWHVLKNRSHSEQGITQRQRNANEELFMGQKPWDVIPAASKGAQSLSKRLSEQITKLFLLMKPSIETELRKRIEDAESRLSAHAADAMPLPSSASEFKKIVAKIAVTMDSEMVKAYAHTNNNLGIALDDIISDFRHVMLVHGHFYELDRSSLVSAPAPSDHKLLSKWQLPAALPAHDMQEHAEELISKAGLYAGQIPEPIYEDLFKLQTGHWSSIMEQYYEKITTLLTSHVMAASAVAIPNASLDGFQQLVVDPRIDVFLGELRERGEPCFSPVKLRMRQAMTAAEKAWEAQYLDTERQRLEATSMVDRTTTRSDTSLDLNPMAHRLATTKIEAKAFPARQAVALMQQAYVDSLDALKQKLDARTVLSQMKKIFKGFTDKVMDTVCDVDVHLIFEPARAEQERTATALKREVAKYKESLALLEDW